MVHRGLHRVLVFLIIIADFAGFGSGALSETVVRGGGLAIRLDVGGGYPPAGAGAGFRLDLGLGSGMWGGGGNVGRGYLGRSG